MKIKFKKNKLSLLERMIYKALKEEINDARSEIEKAREIIYDILENNNLYTPPDQLKDDLKQIFNNTKHEVVRDYILKNIVANEQERLDISQLMVIYRFLQKKYFKENPNFYIKYKKYNNKNIENKDFSNKSFINADFTNAKVNGANFSGANLKGVIFDTEEIVNVNFSGANLEGAIFRTSLIGDVDFSGAFLQHADVRIRPKEIENTSSDSEGYNENFDFYSGIPIENTNFTGADIRDADFASVVFDRCDLTNVKTSNRTNFDAADLSDIIIRNNSGEEIDLGISRPFSEEEYKLIKPIIDCSYDQDTKYPPRVFYHEYG